jgi:hypothetical protein
MFVLQTLHDFVDNPMGKGSNALPGRQLIKNDLKERYEKIVSGKKVDLTIYKKNDEYYFHFLIPSEDPKRKNTYDVILQFIPDDNSHGDKNLNNYFVRFFSNSPSFTYTYAYAFNLYGLFVEELDHKFDEQTFDSPPVVRNPGEVISYEKTIFFACTYLLTETKYLIKSTIDLIAKNYSETDFAKKIRNTDKIEIEIKREQNRVNREEEISKSKDSTSSKKIDPTKLGGKDKRVSTTSSQPKNGNVDKFMDKGKIAPRRASRSKIRPK